MTDGSVHLYYITAAGNSHHLAAGQLLSRPLVRYGKAGGTARPSRTESHLPPAGQAGRRVGPDL